LVHAGLPSCRAGPAASTAMGWLEPRRGRAHGRRKPEGTPIM